MTLSKREKAILYSCIIMVVAAGLYVFIIEPTAKEWSELEKKVRSKETKLNRDLKIAAEKEQLNKKFTIVKQKLKTISSDEGQPASWLTQLETLAGQAQLQISNIEPLPPKEYDFYKKSSIHMILSCNLAGLNKFLYKIQNLPAMVSVEKLEITPASRDASLLKVEMLISTVLPYRD
ncbi:MAG: type 4a pilus biogenesis protein PilO [Candidatus Aureabacteria bacterium]|nr:type 4a pilus biogenesis protein PilO [Candidatus Auribacterota bacterium]